MEELQPEELEDLVQELQAVSDEEEALPPEVEELLRDLQPDSHFAVRKKAAEQLGSLGTSHQRIVSTLIDATAFDKNHLIRTLAEESLRAPVHQDVLQEHPDLVQRARSAAEQAAVQRERRRQKQREKQREQQDDLGIEARECVEHRRVKPDSNRYILLVIPAAIVVAGIGLANVSDSSGWWLLILGAILLAGWVLWEFMAQESYHNAFTRSMKETVVVVDRVYTERHKKESDYGSRTFYKYFVVVCLPPDDEFDPGYDYHLILQVSEGIWFPLDCGSKVRIRYAAEDPRIALIEGEW